MDEGENRVLRIQFDEDLQPAARRNHGENGRVQKILESGIHKDHENIKIDKSRSAGRKGIPTYCS